MKVLSCCSIRTLSTAHPRLYKHNPMSNGHGKNVIFTIFMFVALTLMNFIVSTEMTQLL